jgi:hypothetical protein
VKWPGKSGRYFRVLNWASLNGLSSQTCGRLCDWVMPRSASRKATGLDRVAGLAATFPGFAGLTQQPVKRRDRPEVSTFIEQGGPYLGRCGIDEPLAVEHLEDRGPLLASERAGLRPVTVRGRRRSRRCGAGPVAPVVAGLRGADRCARCPHADLLG